jgi:hypothetical protein
VLDLLLGANMVSTMTTGAGSGFTQRMLTNPDGDIAQDRFVTSAGFYTASAPLSSSGTWVMQLAAFRMAVVPTPTPTPTPTPAPTPATPSYVQGNYAVPQTPQATVTLPFTAAQTAKNLNVVIVGWNVTIAKVSSVTDTKGNLYQLAIGPTQLSGASSQSMYYAKDIAELPDKANGVTVTVARAAIWTGIRDMNIAESIHSMRWMAGRTGQQQNQQRGAVTTRNATDLLVGANMVSTMTSGAGSGFTRRLPTNPDC